MTRRNVAGVLVFFPDLVLVAPAFEIGIEALERGHFDGVWCLAFRLGLFCRR